MDGSTDGGQSHNGNWLTIALEPQGVVPFLISGDPWSIGGDEADERNFCALLESAISNQGTFYDDSSILFVDGATQPNLRWLPLCPPLLHVLSSVWPLRARSR